MIDDVYFRQEVSFPTLEMMLVFASIEFSCSTHVAIMFAFKFMILNR